jgi:site-specific recombinase XerD
MTASILWYQTALSRRRPLYCPEPRLALNRAVVLRYRLHLENIPLAPSTINVRLAAIRRIAYEAADTGLLSPELVAGIRRVKGVKRLGQPVGNWLTAQQGHLLLTNSQIETIRGKRDRAMLGLLLGCGLRRSELVTLKSDQIQKREDHWVPFADEIPSRGRRTDCSASCVFAHLSRYISDIRPNRPRRLFLPQFLGTATCQTYGNRACSQKVGSCLEFGRLCNA